MYWSIVAAHSCMINLHSGSQCAGTKQPGESYGLMGEFGTPLDNACALGRCLMLLACSGTVVCGGSRRLEIGNEARNTEMIEERLKCSNGVIWYCLSFVFNLDVFDGLSSKRQTRRSQRDY